MRWKSLCILLAFAGSCKPTINKNNLLGSWTTNYDKAKYPNNNISDKVTFFEGDSLRIEYLLDGKLQESHPGRYSLEEQKMILTTQYDTANFKFEVISLTNETMRVKQVGIKNVLVFKRL
jgi:hypothetical protein